MKAKVTLSGKGCKDVAEMLRATKLTKKEEDGVIIFKSIQNARYALMVTQGKFGGNLDKDTLKLGECLAVVERIIEKP